MTSPQQPPPSRWVLPRPAADAGDLVGVGADLEPGTLLSAYATGLFPMPEPGHGIGWWSPIERGVLRPDDVRISRSLRQARKRSEIRVNTAFDRVVAACAEPRREGHWIDASIAAAYTRLHDLGWAHSVETWRDGKLVGGLYGVALGGLFAGESMFHHARDASKVALVGLVELLHDEHVGQRLIDTQWQTDHLASLGVGVQAREDYLDALPALLAVPLPAAFT